MTPTARQIETMAEAFAQLEPRNASVVLVLVFGLMRDQRRRPVDDGSDEAPAHGGVINRIGYAEFDQRARLHDPAHYLYWRHVARRKGASQCDPPQVQA